MVRREKSWYFLNNPLVRVALRGSLLGSVALSMSLAIALVLWSSASAQTTTFFRPFAIGYENGDDWESDVAADRLGNVYVAWAHYGGVPGCDVCGSPAAMIQVSHNRGRTFGVPHPLNPSPGFQTDLQVAVNDVSIVWVAYLSNKDALVQRSNDFGQTWLAPVAANVDIKEAWTDKVGLAVRGDDVYVSFSIAQRYYVSYSHDGGHTFTAVQLNSQSKDTGWTLTNGGAVDSQGNVYFSWVGIHQSGNALGPQEVFLTKSPKGGRGWSFITLKENLPPSPDCSVFACGWDFWGPQMVVSVDAADNVYVAYNAAVKDQVPPYVWFQASTDGGDHWTDRKVVHSDGESSAYHLFPAMVGGSNGEVHISWMDNRLGKFNVYYRTSTDGGSNFGPEVRVNKDLGFNYQSNEGFDFTYGDYYGIARDDGGNIHIAWGEGPGYKRQSRPGNVFYVRTR